VYAYIYEGNGKIIREISTSTEEMLLANIETGDDYVISEEPFKVDDTYVLNGVLTPRPSFSLSLSKSTMTADNTDYINLTGVPSGATVTLSRVGASKTVTADGTTIQIKTPLPGKYTVTVEKFPYRNGVVNFVATANT